MLTCSAMADTERGVASWYGPGFNGRITSSGEIFNQNKLTAAYDKVPLGSKIMIVCPETHKEVVVRTNDHGNFRKKYHRIIDMSKAAAKVLGLSKKGVAQVIVIPLKIAVDSH